MATDAQRHYAAQAALYAATRPRARLIHCRPSGALLLITLARPNGTIALIRATTADQPEFDSLAERDRSRVRSAFLALAAMQTEGPRDAA